MDAARSHRDVDHIDQELSDLVHEHRIVLHIKDLVDVFLNDELLVVACGLAREVDEGARDATGASIFNLEGVGDEPIRVQREVFHGWAFALSALP